MFSCQEYISHNMDINSYHEGDKGDSYLKKLKGRGLLKVRGEGVSKQALQDMLDEKQALIVK